MFIEMQNIGGESGGSMEFNSAEGIDASYNVWTDTSVPVVDITSKGKVIVTLSYTAIYSTACWSIENGVATLDYISPNYENNLAIDLTSTFLRIKQLWDNRSIKLSVVTYLFKF